MPQYLTPSGQQCTADAAIIGGKLRPGYREVLANGERLQFDINLRDGRPSSGEVFLRDAPALPPKSIDEAVHRAIEAEAAAAGVKPSAWLSQNAGPPLTKLIEKAASDFVAAAGATGISSAFSMDAAGGSLSDPSFGRALRDAACAAQYGGSAAVELARLSEIAERGFADTQARLSEQRRNGWRNPGDDRAVRDAARAARYS